MTAIPLTLQYMRRILLVGDADEDTMAGLATHCDVLKQVHLADLESLNDEPYDCIIFADVPQDVHVTAAGRLLDVHGAAYFFDPPSMPESTGLRAYVEWDWHGRRVCMTVSKSYDPVHHARELFKRGHPEMSLEVLMNVPDGFSSTPHDMARLASEKQLCYLAWDQTAEPGERLNRFFREQREFYKAVTPAPHHHPAYIWHAEFWRRIGDAGMAARLLRSIEHVAPDDSVLRQLITLNPAPVDHAAEDPPVWSGEFRPRILIMCHNHSDYGLDTLYDGLIRLLGPDNVIEFPWKPTLHGQAPVRSHGYPCTFNHPG